MEKAISFVHIFVTIFKGGRVSRGWSGAGLGVGTLKGFLVSWFLVFLVSKCLGFEVSWFQSCKDLPNGHFMFSEKY